MGLSCPDSQEGVRDLFEALKDVERRKGGWKDRNLGEDELVFKECRPFLECITQRMVQME